jgi:type VI secretion system protein VasG
VTIPFYPLSDDMLKGIARLQLGRIQRRVQQNHRVPFTFDEGVIDLIITRCTERESGGRMIDNILTNSMLPALSNEFLTRMMNGAQPERVHVAVKDGEFTYAFA